jgi:hypothetical protein
MSSTSIQWTDHSINPIRARLRVPKPGDYVRKLNTAGVLGVAPPVVGGYGSGVGHYCEKISPGCAKCYASTSQKRFGMPEFPGASKSSPTPPTLDDRGVVVANETTEIFFDGSRLQEVLRRRKPTKFFWCDQTDLFGSWVPFEWIDRCFRDDGPDALAHASDPDEAARSGCGNTSQKRTGDEVVRAHRESATP